LPTRLGGFTVGVLVQSNFGGVLTINGAPVGQELDRYYLRDDLKQARNRNSKETDAGGSIIIVIATDAPVDARNLQRMGARAMMGLARTGAACETRPKLNATRRAVSKHSEMTPCLRSSWP
jgi:D-aminopeptidase